MYEDTPMAKIGEVFENLIFSGNSLSWDTAGTPETVRNIKRGDFVSYRKIHYYPENMLVSVTGGVSENKAIELVKKYFEFAHPGSGIGGIEAIRNFQTKQNSPQVKLKTKKEEQAHFILGFLGDGRKYEGRYAQGIFRRF